LFKSVLNKIKWVIGLCWAGRAGTMPVLRLPDRTAGRLPGSFMPETPDMPESLDANYTYNGGGGGGFGGFFFQPTPSQGK